MFIKLDDMSVESRRFIVDNGTDKNKLNSIAQAHSIVKALCRNNKKHSKDESDNLIGVLSNHVSVELDDVRDYVKCWSSVYKVKTKTKLDTDIEPIYALFGLEVFAPDELNHIMSKDFITLCNGYTGVINES